MMQKKQYIPAYIQLVPMQKEDILTASVMDEIPDNLTDLDIFY